MDKEKELTEQEFIDWLQWIDKQNFSANKTSILTLIGTFGESLCLLEEVVCSIKQKKYKEVANQFLIDRKDKLME